MRAVLLTAIASIGLVGCVGELDTTGGGTGGGTGDGTGNGDGTGGGGGGDGGDGTESAQAKMLYDSNVYPIMAAKCIACHNLAGPVGNISGFVAPEVTTAWETITGFQSLVGNFTPTLAGVLTKVQAGHQGVAYSN